MIWIQTADLADLAHSADTGQHTSDLQIPTDREMPREITFAYMRSLGYAVVAIDNPMLMPDNWIAMNFALALLYDGEKYSDTNFLSCGLRWR